MDKWEEAGFASQEAYDEVQQTIAEGKEREAKLQIQADEKQKVIDSNRTKMSELTDAKKELDQLKEDRKKAEEARLEKEKETPPVERTPEDIKKANEERISKLSEEQRKGLQEEYTNANQGQKDILSTPEGMEAYLELKVQGEKSPSDNPFAPTAEKAKSIKQQVAEAFKLDNQTPVTPARVGSGFDPANASEPVKKARQVNSEKVEKAKESLLKF